MVGDLFWNTVLPCPGSHLLHLHACTCQSSKNLLTMAAEMQQLLPELSVFVDWRLVPFGDLRSINKMEFDREDGCAERLHAV